MLAFRRGVPPWPWQHPADCRFIVYNITRICAAEMAVRYAALCACRKVHVCHFNSLGGATWRSLMITGRTDRRTDRQTDRQSATQYAAPSYGGGPHNNYDCRLDFRPWDGIKRTNGVISCYAALLHRRGRILRRTLSVRLSVCLSVCPSVPLSLPSVTSRHLANYNDTRVLFGTHWGPHIVRHLGRTNSC